MIVLEIYFKGQLWKLPVSILGVDMLRMAALNVFSTHVCDSPCPIIRKYLFCTYPEN